MSAVIIVGIVTGGVVVIVAIVALVVCFYEFRNSPTPETSDVYNTPDRVRDSEITDYDYLRISTESLRYSAFNRNPADYDTVDDNYLSPVVKPTMKPNKQLSTTNMQM